MKLDCVIIFFFFYFIIRDSHNVLVFSYPRLYIIYNIYVYNDYENTVNDLWLIFFFRLFYGLNQLNDHLIGRKSDKNQ